MSAPFETHRFAGPARELSIDVFQPAASELRTAIVILHGGGLRGGSREAVHGRAAELASLGFVACAAEYRLLGEAAWPAPLDDVRSAIGWVRENADSLGIAPDRIVAQGQSAGGYLALLAAANGPLAAVVAFYPTIGLYPEPPPAQMPDGPPHIEQAPDGTIPSWRVLGDDVDGEHISDASPIRQIDGSFPPTILFHGAADTLVRSFSTVIFYDRLTALGVPVDLHLYAHAVHEFDLTPEMCAVTSAETASFIRRYVVDPEGARAADAAANPFAPGGAFERGRG